MKLTSERRWIWIFAATLVVVTGIPYLLGYGSQNANWKFSGFVFGVEDGNSYIAKMLNGANGEWLFRTPYTTFPQSGVISFIPFILLGKLTSAPGQHGQLVALFQLFRAAATFALTLAAYDFISLFIQKEIFRRWGLAVILLGGGLGWLLVMIGQGGWLGSLPLEFYSPESFGFLEIFGLPHLAAARACLLWGLCAYIHEVRSIIDKDQHTNRTKWKTGLWLLAASLFQPLTAFTCWALIGLHLLLTGIWAAKQNSGSVGNGVWGKLLQLGIAIGVISCPMVLYTGLTSLLDPFVKLWSAQNRLYSPNPLHYLAAYLIVLPFAVVGAVKTIKRDPVKGGLLICWLLLLPLLAYLPITIQRRLPEGIWFAWVILAVACFDLSERVEFKRWIWILGFTFPSSLILFAGAIQTAIQPRGPAFVQTDIVDGFQYFNTLPTDKKVILAAFSTSNEIAAWTPQTVVVGQGPESIYADQITPEITQFFSPDTPDPWRSSLLSKLGVDYVFWGPDEKKLGSWDPGSSGKLTPVYEKGDVEVFQVNHALP